MTTWGEVTASGSSWTEVGAGDNLLLLETSDLLLLENGVSGIILEGWGLVTQATTPWTIVS